MSLRLLGVVGGVLLAAIAAATVLPDYTRIQRVVVDTTKTAPSLRRAYCSGDCNGDGIVSAEEVDLLVAILGGTKDISLCYPGDYDMDGTIFANEISIAAANRYKDETNCTYPPPDTCSNANATCTVWGGSGDFDITVTPENTPVASIVLLPGNVTAFHLSTDADANNNTVANVATATTARDALPVGQAVLGSDFSGTLPAPALANPRSLAAVSATIPSISFTNVTVPYLQEVTVEGAQSWMVPVVTFYPRPLDDGVAYMARIPRVNTVELTFYATDVAKNTSSLTAYVSVLR